jgi:hypothetical protein
MEKLYDPTVKTLVETAPADWLVRLRLPRARVSVIDADLATVLSGAADKVLRVPANPEYLPLDNSATAGLKRGGPPRRLFPTIPYYPTALPALYSRGTITTARGRS